MTDLNRLLQRLCDADIDFVIVGGFAAMLHGSSLLTRDLDVCAVLTAENVERLREVLRELHPVHRMTTQRLSFMDNPDPGTPLKNLYLQTDSAAGPAEFHHGSGETLAASVSLPWKSTCSAAGPSHLPRRPDHGKRSPRA